jgi:regulatory protein
MAKPAARNAPAARKVGARPPKPPTPERLRRRALYYLERFAASRAHLGHVLARRALRDAAALDLPPAPVRAAIDDLLDDLERLGLLDDTAFAEARAQKLARKGKPPRRIAQDLASRGVGRELALATTSALEEASPDLELETAIAFARRRRLGPFAREDTARAPDKALAAFARAGFSSTIARRVLGASSIGELEGDGD